MKTPIRQLTDTDHIHRILEIDPYLNLYAIGDLDDFYRRYTRWFGFHDNDAPAIALLYDPGGVPTLLGLSVDPDAMGRLLGALAPELPERVYAHLSPGAEGALLETFTAESTEHYLKMALDPNAFPSGDHRRCAKAGDGAVVCLRPEDREEVETLYHASYPGNWFDPRMLETGRYVGCRMEGALVAVAGVHVYSPAYRVAAIGNVTTRPAYRNRGLGGRTTAALAEILLTEGLRVGLNVHRDNLPALTAYQRLGFRTVAEYTEYSLVRK